jgi:hypothetical protein
MPARVTDADLKRLRRPAPRRGLPPQSEDAFVRQLVQFARLHGWRCAHFRPARTKAGGWVTPVQFDGAGFPDLLCIHPKWARVVVCEVKRDRGRPPTSAQLDWLRWFALAGATAHVFRPKDWPLIETVLGTERGA